MQHGGKIIYAELSYRLNGILFRIHNDLGRFCREKQYGDFVETYLQKEGIVYKREYDIPLVSGEIIEKSNRVDFLIDEKIILELKTKLYLSREDYFQVKRYLQCSGYKLGILVNFQSPRLVVKRILNSLGSE